MNKENAFYIRNRSASIQLTVFAKDGKEAREIAHTLIGQKNKSLLRSIPASKVIGYN